MSGIESGTWAVIRRIFGGWLRGSEAELTSTLISRSGYNIIFLLLRKVPYEYVWLRIRVCVLSKTHETNVWLTKTKWFIVDGPTINCMRNASRWKAEKYCFLARLSIQRLVHYSVNSVAWYTVQWTVYHVSTVQWTVEAYSTVHWTVEHVNSARIALFTWILFYFIFQYVNFFKKKH